MKKMFFSLILFTIALSVQVKSTDIKQNRTVSFVPDGGEPIPPPLPGPEQPPKPKP